jgi:hypothetical protein
LVCGDDILDPHNKQWAVEQTGTRHEGGTALPYRSKVMLIIILLQRLSLNGDQYVVFPRLAVYHTFSLCPVSNLIAFSGVALQSVYILYLCFLFMCVIGSAVQPLYTLYSISVVSFTLCSSHFHRRQVGAELCAAKCYSNLPAFPR